MTLFDVLLVALIQGLGEVLPLGASGPLAAFPVLAGTPEGRAALSVAAHVGILLALAAYFWRDVGAMAAGVWKMLKGKPDSGSHLFLHVLAGTLPAAVAGWYLMDQMAGRFGPGAIAAFILGGGVLLLVCDKLGVTVRRIEHMGFPSSIGLGLLQIASMIPGASRTGIIITIARLMGWERQAAARFALLLAMPMILGHASVTFWRLTRQTDVILSTDLAIAAAAAGLAALLAVAGMMAWVERRTFLPLAMARILVGAGALAWVVLSGRG